MPKWLVILPFVLAACLGGTLSWYLHADDHDNLSANQALTPIVVDDARSFHYPLTFVASLKNDPNPGPKIFKAYCSHCHAPDPIIPVNAPIVGHKADWVSRRSLGIDLLFKLSSEGYAAMPARGGCFECSDAMLRKTIQYMLDKS